MLGAADPLQGDSYAEGITGHCAAAPAPPGDGIDGFDQRDAAASHDEHGGHGARPVRSTLTAGFVPASIRMSTENAARDSNRPVPKGRASPVARGTTDGGNVIPLVCDLITVRLPILVAYSTRSRDAGSRALTVRPAPTAAPRGERDARILEESGDYDDFDDLVSHPAIDD